jgi:hypothetical protein
MLQKVTEACKILREKKLDYTTDGMQHIVSWKSPKELFGVDGDPISFILGTETISVTGWGKEEKKSVVIKYINHIQIVEYVRASQGAQPLFNVERKWKSTIPVHRAVHLVIEKAILASNEGIFRQGKNRFFFNKGRQELEPGVFLHEGFFSSVKFGMGSPLLNANLTYGAFYDPLPLTEYLKAYGGNFENLKNMEVEILYTPGKIRTIRGIGGLPPSSQEFEDKSAPGRKLTVLHYLQTKGIDDTLLDRIALSKEFCINTGTAASPEWYPREALKIAESQSPNKLSAGAESNMIAHSSLLPHENIRKMTAILQFLGSKRQDEYGSVLSRSGIQIDQKFVEVPAREVKPPAVMYRNITVTSEKTDRWDLDIKPEFWDTTNPFEGRAAILLPKSIQAQKRQYKGVCKYLCTLLRCAGVAFTASTTPLVFAIDLPCEKISHKGVEKEIEKIISDVLQNSVGLVLFVSHDGSATYANAFDHFKRVSEQKFGIHTLAITEASYNRAFESQGGVEKYVQNLAMKVNVKLASFPAISCCY